VVGLLRLGGEVNSVIGKILRHGMSERVGRARNRALMGGKWSRWPVMRFNSNELWRKPAQGGSKSGHRLKPASTSA